MTRFYLIKGEDGETYGAPKVKGQGFGKVAEISCEDCTDGIDREFLMYTDHTDPAIAELSCACGKRP